MRIYKSGRTLLIVFSILWEESSGWTCSIQSALPRRNLALHSDRLETPSCSPTTVTNTKNELEVLQYYTQRALRYYQSFYPQENGSNLDASVGLEALEQLRELSLERRPFDFDAPRIHSEGSVVSKVSSLLPSTVTKQITKKLHFMAQQQGWLSTNADSVDGLPSFHLNLISNGRPIVDLESKLDEQDGKDSNDHHQNFDHSIQQLIEWTTPYIYHDLLPRVHQLLNSTKISVSDVFLRRYGDDVMDGQARHGISAHYDVFSKVTSVIALDDTAQHGTNGLYTTQVVPSSTLSSSSSCGNTCNHAAMRRFFPLGCGDAVIHTWDILHGVDVEPGLDRTSLIVWFSVEEEHDDDRQNEDLFSSWLWRRSDLDTNHVAQFVLASALESSANTENTEQQKRRLDLYLQSASCGNSFALARMGGVCETMRLDPSMVEKIESLLSRLEKSNPIESACTETSSLSPETEQYHLDLAKRFWWQSACQGNPRAQMALADEVMMDASVSDNPELAQRQRLLASILFALAAQQGNPDALDSLSRVIQVDLAFLQPETQEEFLSLPIIQVSQAALGEEAGFV